MNTKPKKKNRLLKFLIAIIVMMIFSLSVIYFDLKYFENAFNSGSTDTEMTLQSIDDVTEKYVQQYLQSFIIIFGGQSYSEFSDKDISIFLAYAYIMNNVRSNADVQQFVKDYFNKDNFNLKPGRYTSNMDKFNIYFENGVYTTNLVGHGGPNVINQFKSLDINGNNVIATYSYDLILDNYPDEYENKGFTKVYMEYKNNNLIIKKTIYTSK